ncbi:MAG: hypothetical protein AAFP20_25910, partial [Cyanobacteria bacterium J06614_10]
MDLKVKGKKPRKRRKRPRIKVWDLKGEKVDQFKRMVRERRQEGKIVQGVENIWTEMKGICVGVAEEIVGRTSAYGATREEKWWWNEEVQESLKRKSKAFKDWKVRNTQGGQDRYIEENRNSKRKIGAAIGRVSHQL